MCCKIIKKDLFDAIIDFCKGAPLPRGITSTMIILIPKKQGALHWKDYRPINLCNINSKIISEIVTNRAAIESSP